ncbi:PD-(D/E)XK nuclease family protein [Lentilactobacillus senioris]|uniref:PD-(D/E)XK nuclease family protein n=1 Tax=Lentilactobacillus senioris TaxID=931534 RepID=UPI002092700E|nr:PD-(D/E)XK nuclease family protein [Lentilactobacillus senioris]
MALTRAEQKLYLVANLKKAPESVSELITDWQAKTSADQLLLPEALRENANSYLDWIGPAVSRQPDVVATYGGDSLGSSVLVDDPTKIQIHLITDQQLAEAQPVQLTGSQRAKEWMTKMTPQPNSIDEPKGTEKATSRTQIDAILDFNYPYQTATKTTAYQAVSEVKRLFDDPDNVELGSYQLLDVDQVGAKQAAFTTPLNRPQFLQEQQAPKATEIGTATHLILQQLPLTAPPTDETIQEVIERLVADNVLDDTVAQQINANHIHQFYQSELGKLVVANEKQTKREVPFSLLIPAQQIFTGFENDTEQSVLIHGIIDGYTIANDELILFDYKTDHVAGSDSVEQIVDRYKGQLELYGIALAHVLDRPVTHKYLFLLDSGETVEIK